MNSAFYKNKILEQSKSPYPIKRNHVSLILIKSFTVLFTRIKTAVEIVRWFKWIRHRSNSKHNVVFVRFHFFSLFPLIMFSDCNAFSSLVFFFFFRQVFNTGFNNYTHRTNHCCFNTQKTIIHQKIHIEFSSLHSTLDY
jgi:hypothetical protein